MPCTSFLRKMFAKIWRLFSGGQKNEVLPNPSDHVYPVHILDHTVRDSSVTWLMRFNDVLDGDKLHTSLTKVLETGDWKKLGGRLRSDKSGNLTLHVPERFTPERPAIAYTCEAFDIDLEQHPWGSQLPMATDEPSLQYTMHHLTSFWKGTKVPASCEEYLQRDDPSLSLHVATFQNATLVALDFPHPISDMMGVHALVKAWCLVLAGREGEVPPLLGAQDDVSRAVWGTSRDEPFQLQPRMLTGWRLVRFLVGYVVQVLRQPRVDARALVLPAAFVADVRARALADLGGETFVSDSDVLCAWLARLVVAARADDDGVGAPAEDAPLAIGNSVDIRGKVPAVFRAGGAYAQNLSTLSFAFFGRTDGDRPGSGDGLLDRLSLGAMAYRIRRSLIDQTSEAETRATYRAIVRYYQRHKRLPLFGDADATPMLVANWTKARFVEDVVDFGPAVVRVGDTSAARRNPPGRMLYLLGGSLQKPVTARNFVVINGRDCAGNYWVTLYMVRAAFDMIEEFLQGGSSGCLDPLHPTGPRNEGGR